MNRRHLTPPTGIRGILAQRRGAGGARREISAHITLRSRTEEYDGWALNVSRGGIRVVIEGRIHPGQVLVIEGYDPDNPDAPARRGRVVWSQDEPDGSVVGMEFIDVDESVHPPSVRPASVSPDEPARADDEAGDS
ncbi:MAG: PilZ domain-containing protein [Myxococcota bacterium]